MESKNQVKTLPMYQAIKDRHNAEFNRTINNLPMVMAREHQNTQQILQNMRVPAPKNAKVKSYDLQNKPLKTGEHQDLNGGIYNNDLMQQVITLFSS